MDGNRRFARLRNKEVAEGHREGFKALKKVLETCLRLNIRCVTVYAFSIENFKRSQSEVEALMTLAKQKLEELCEQGGLLEEYGVRLNVIGRVSMLPQDVQAAVYKAEEMTKDYNNAILNICMPYTSRDEMATAVQSIVQKCRAGDLNAEEISEYEIDAELLTSLRGSPPLDILIRTSGVKRLSDFLLWQTCENTQIHFSSAYWPEFGLRHFAPILLEYQRKAWSQI
jgi:ditrans,polycis-polyprenyl diphosphate synthase